MKRLWSSQVGTSTRSVLSLGIAKVVDSSLRRPGMPPNKRLKLAARVDEGMNLSSARRSLSAVR
jgi:hypothetical protein